MRDWLVDCNDCPARYTPKARENPQECHACESEDIDARRFTRAEYETAQEDTS